MGFWTTFLFMAKNVLLRVTYKMLSIGNDNRKISKNFHVVAEVTESHLLTS